MAQRKMSKQEKEALVARLQAGRVAKQAKKRKRNATPVPTATSRALTRRRLKARPKPRPKRLRKSLRATRVSPRNTRVTSRTLSDILRESDARDNLQRAKRALRGLHRAVWFPKAVVHSNQVHPREHHTIEEEIPEQALIEHWEAIGELKRKGIDIRHADWPVRIPTRLKEIELETPVSMHARRFASRHGLVVRERLPTPRRIVARVLGH
ncbi:MAG: hypothetical protein Q8P05_01905 [Candidatus Diapherotrites archaeon]|nr:hypothetical protein [Candidatus Diapherotrites archaeon]MDZ4256521.1 hypothetical protein [archaeon]